MHFSGNLAVVIERRRAMHGNENAHLRSLTFHLYSLRRLLFFFFLAFYILVSLVDYNSRALLCLHFYTAFAISI